MGAEATGIAPMRAAATRVAATRVAATGGAEATGVAAMRAAATGAAATGAAATGAAILGAAPLTKRLKSAVFASRASARSAIVSKKREGRLSGSFALKSPEIIRGIEEMDEELSFQFLDDELQREEEEREEEEEEEVGEEEEQREEDEKPAHRPLKPSLPSQHTACLFCVCCGYKFL